MMYGQQTLVQTLRRNWKITLFAIFFLPLLISLGNWQLSRAEEKQQRQTVYQQLSQLPAIPLSELNQDAYQTYRKVELRGVFDRERYWLLDNRSREGRSGYEVLMPLIGDSQGLVLVNRGWLQAPANRERLPDFETPEGEITIQGYLYPAETNAWFKHSESDLLRNWPQRVLQLDPTAGAEVLGEKVFPFIIRLDDLSEGALITAWPLINSGPEKHTAYAWQWFAMALALCLLYVWVLFKKDH